MGFRSLVPLALVAVLTGCREGQVRVVPGDAEGRLLIGKLTGTKLCQGAENN